MYCVKCGKLLDSETNHICTGSSGEAFKPKLNLSIPKPPPRTSAAYETTSISLSDHVPGNLTLEEVLSRKPLTLGFLQEVKKVLSTWKAVFKKPSKENIILLITGVLFFLIWAWTKYIPGPYSLMKPEGIKSVLAVALGTFNNVPARILHYSCLVTLVAAFVPSIFTGQGGKIIGNIKGTYILAKKVISYKHSKTLYVALIALGSGMFFANYLMRNNSQNKYIVCLTLGFTVLLSTSGLFDSSAIRLTKGLYNDLLRILKIQKYITKYTLMIQFGFGLGLISSYLACIIRGIRSTAFTDNIAYVLGVLIVIAGVVLLFIPANKIGKTA